MNISVTGRLGSGKSTVCAIMNKKFGYEIYHTGKIQREIADGMGIDTLELNRRMTEDSALDHVIDDAVTDISVKRKDDGLIFDSRMAWHFAASTFKVYMYVEPFIGAKRVTADGTRGREQYGTAEEAVTKLEERATLELERFKKIYGVDYSNYANYDLVIDTTYLSAEEIADIIEAEHKKYKNGEYSGTKLLLCPKAIYPLTEADGEIKIKAKNGYNYALSGFGELAEAVKSGKKHIEAALSEEKLPESAEKGIIERYEKITFQTFERLPAIYE